MCLIDFFVWLSFWFDRFFFGSPRWFPVVLPRCGCHVEAPQGHPSPQSLVALPFPPTRARVRISVSSFMSRNLRNSGSQSVCRQSPKSCAFASVRARIGVRSFTSGNLRDSGPQSVCRQSPMSCAFASVRARIGVRSFTSRNLRNSGPQSVCRQSPKLCAFASARAHWRKVIHVPKPWK